MNILEELAKNRACDEGLNWVREQTYASYNDLWQICPQGGWMLWLLEERNIEPDKKTLVKMSCEIAKTVLHLVSAHRESMAGDAIDIAKKWLRDGSTGKDPRWFWFTPSCDALSTAYNAASTAYPEARYRPLIAARACACCADSVDLDGLAKRADIVRKYIPEVSC